MNFAAPKGSKVCTCTTSTTHILSNRPFTPQQNSFQGAEAETLLVHYFPQYIRRGNSAILIRSVGNTSSSVICNYTREFTYYIKEGLTTKYDDPTYLQEFESYWTLHDADMDMAALQLVTEDESAMIIEVGGREKTSANSTRFVKHLIRLIDDFTKDERFEIERTGDDIIMQDFYSLCVSEIIVTDSISASIALLVMLVLVRSLVLMIIPFLNLVCALLCTLGAMYAITLAANVATFVPAIIIAVLIAMTIDYSLFMLVRFRRELDEVSPNGEAISDHDYEEAVHTTVCFAGHVISISGSTLAIAFAGICMLRIELLVTMGLGAALGLFCTILVNLTLGPAMLFTFPRFFATPGIIPCAPQFLARKKHKSSTSKDTMTINNIDSTSATQTTSETQPLIGDKKGTDMEGEKETKEEITSSGWYRIASLLTKTEGAWLIIFLVTLALFPIMYGVRWFKISVNNSLVFTPDLPAMKTLNDMQESFPPGMLYPFYLSAVARNESVGGTFTQEYFAAIPDVIKNIKNVTNNEVDDSGIISTAFAYGSEVDFEMAREFLDPTSPEYNSSYAQMYRMLTDRVLSKDAGHNSSLTMLMVNFNPNGGPIREWVLAVRGVLDNLNEHSPWYWTLSSVFVALVDVCAESFGAFPMMISITVIVIVVLVAVAFRSVVLPLRLVLSLGLTIVWTYGAASLVFCMDALDWLPGLKDVNALYWLIPLVVLTIIVGLGIDYDVFLFSRITEERERGYTADEAIRLGYYHTGGVITGAGVVMAIAFSGLMISKQHVLQQLGFFLSISVLLDTFVIRMLLVPALLHLLGDANWWPHKMPRPHLPDLCAPNKPTSNPETVHEEP